MAGLRDEIDAIKLKLNEIDTIKLQLSRIVSDSESEKGTRKRVNSEYLSVLRDMSIKIDERFEKTNTKLENHAMLIYIGMGILIAIEVIIKVVGK